MKKLLMCMVAAAMLTVFSIGVQAADAQKIAIVDIQEILQKAPQVDKIRDNLKSQFGKREQQLVNAQKQLQADADKLHKDGPTMNKSARQTLENKIVKEQETLQQSQMTFQQDFMQAQNNMLNDFINLVKQKVGDIAKKNGYTMVLAKAGVIYSADQTDITNDVIASLK